MGLPHFLLARKGWRLLGHCSHWSAPWASLLLQAPELTPESAPPGPWLWPREEQPQTVFTKSYHVSPSPFESRFTLCGCGQDWAQENFGQMKAEDIIPQEDLPTPNATLTNRVRGAGRKMRRSRTWAVTRMGVHMYILLGAVLGSSEQLASPKLGRVDQQPGDAS